MLFRISINFCLINLLFLHKFAQIWSLNLKQSLSESIEVYPLSKWEPLKIILVKTPNTTEFPSKIYVIFYKFFNLYYSAILWELLKI